MAINWGKVLEIAVDITAAVGAAAMQAAAIDNAVERCRRLSTTDLIVGFTREVTQMDEQVWGAWRRRLVFLANQNDDQTARFMCQIGDFTRAEMRTILQITQYPIAEAIDLTIERMRDQKEPDRICFFVIMAMLGQRDLKADTITKRIIRMLEA